MMRWILLLISASAVPPGFDVPAAYWATGAATRLSTRARYGLSEYTLSLGLLELERETAAYKKGSALRHVSTTVRALRR